MTADGTLVSPPHRAGAKLPFVGRDSELAALTAGPVPSTTIVLGEGGIGKTRLLAEVADRGDQTVLYGRAWRGGDNTPYVPWTQVLSGARQLLGTHEIGRFRDLAPLLSTGTQQPRFAHSESMQHVLGLALGDYLREVAAGCSDGLIVVIEDLHHCDGPSIALASTVARQRLPIALVATSRPLDQAKPDNRELLDLLLDEAAIIELQPLGDDEVESILITSDISPDRFGAAAAATAGVPLLLDHWVRTSSAQDGLDYEASVSKSIDDLSTDGRKILVTAALMGDVFDLSVAVQANELDVALAMAQIDTAVASGLIVSVEGSPTRYRFAHDSVREVLDGRQTSRARAVAHGRVLSVLLDRRGTAGEVDISVLAAHSTQAAFLGDANVAVELNIEAGEAAIGRAAPGLALTNFQNAIDVGAAAGSSRRSRAVAELGIAKAHKMAGDGRASVALLGVLDSAEHSEELTDLGVEAALLLPSNVGALGLGPDRDAVVVRWLEWALDVVGDRPSITKARLLIELGLQTYARSAEQGELLMVEAAELAEHFDDGPLLVQALCHRHWFRRYPGNMADVLAEIERLESRIGATDTEARLSLAGLSTSTLLRAGRFTEALAEVHSLEAELSPLPPSAQWSIGRWRATIHYVRGDHRAAEAEGLAAFALVDQTPLGVIAFDYLGLLLAGVMQARMQHDAIIDMTSAMVESPSPLLATSAKAGAAMILAEMGRTTEARDLLSQVPRTALDYRDPYELAWLPGAAFLSQAGVALNDAEQSALYLDALEPYRDEWVIWGSGFMCFGPVALRRAQAALVAGRVDIAAADLKVARQEIVQAGARLFLPPLLCAEADLMSANGEVVTAVSAMCEASDVCAELDLTEAAAMMAGRAFELSADLSVPTEQGSRHRSLRRDDSIWSIDFDGEAAAIGHVKGLVVLKLLVSSPHRQFHALELAAAVDGVVAGSSSETTGPNLDTRAFAEYRSRVSELEAEIAEASTFGDGERASAARLELDALLEQLMLATGLGGRARSGASNAERARVRITKSVRSAIGRIGRVAPKAGSHLSISVRTGSFCAYEPEEGQPAWSNNPK